MKQKDLLLYLPVGATNGKAIGGQVTAAKSIVRYFKQMRLKYDIVDSAQATGFSWVLRRIIILVTISQVLYFSLFRRYRSSLFFYSTVAGLALRFMPAIALRSRGVTTSIFFRNSSLVHASQCKLRVVKFLLSPYLNIFVQGSNLKDFLIGQGVSDYRIKVIPNWLPDDLGCRKHGYEYNKNSLIKFIYTGNISSNKGVFELLSSVRGIRQRDRFTLTFVGDGEAREAGVRYCDEYGLTNVSFVDAMPHSEVIKLLTHYDVLVLPSYNEGFPNSVIEAMSVGLPVIVTNVGEITDTVVNDYNGIVVKPKSVESLRNAMEAYLINTDLIALHAENAILSVESRHDWEANCQLLTTLLLR